MIYKLNIVLTCTFKYLHVWLPAVLAFIALKLHGYCMDVPHFAQREQIKGDFFFIIKFRIVQWEIQTRWTVLLESLAVCLLFKIIFKYWAVIDGKVHEHHLPLRLGEPSQSFIMASRNTKSRIGNGTKWKSSTCFNSLRRRAGQGHLISQLLEPQ